MILIARETTGNLQELLILSLSHFGLGYLLRSHYQKILILCHRDVEIIINFYIGIYM